MTETRRARLTKRTVDQAMPAASRYILWDTELPGFGLRVEPGGKRTFVARYRAGGGRAGILRQATIGRHGTLTPDEARSAARKLLGAAASGADPVAVRKGERQAGLTVAEVCDWYLREAASGRLIGRRGRPIKPSTLAMDRSRIDTHVRPLVGRSRVSMLSVPDFEAMQATIAAGVTPVATRDGRGGVATGGGGVAARTLGMLATILEHARRAGLVRENPARGARKLAGARKRQRLSLDEVRSLGRVLRMAETEGENPTALAAIRLILMTGLRRQEALGLRREWILPAGGIDFPDTKSGAQVRPVGRAAIDLLSRLGPPGAQEGWMFPSVAGDGHLVGLPKVLARLTARAGLPPITIHTLRHTFASVAAELGYSELTIAGLLGHTSGSITAHYVHLDSAVVSAADRVSAVIAAALDGVAPADVVPMPTRSLGR